MLSTVNVEFVRKGFVANGTIDDENILDPILSQLVNDLKTTFNVTSSDTNEITTAIQLWKEKLLYHTLQTIDQSAQDEDLHERQIQAIEFHEKVTKDVKEAVIRVLQQLLNKRLIEIENFTLRMTDRVQTLIQSEPSKELVMENDKLVSVLEEKAQSQLGFEKANSELAEQVSNLTKRLSMMETDPDRHGCTILRQNLQAQVQQLTVSQQLLQDKVAIADHDLRQQRFELERAREEVELLRRTLLMTKAMHEKETKQLVGMLQRKGEQWEKIHIATQQAETRADTAFNTTDPYSGRIIRYTVPNKPETSIQSPTKSLQSRPVTLACLPHPSWSAGSVSPQQKPSVRTLKSTAADNSSPDIVQGSSPTGRVSRPFSTSPRRL